MFLLRSIFLKDIVILVVITVLIISLLSIVIGYLADYYFGDTIGGLFGEYGEYDFALILGEEAKERAYEEIKDIIDSKFPGSELVLGIEILGKTNFFIKLDSKYRSRENYINIDDKYFKNITGLNSVSVMTEPRITIAGLRSEVRTLIEPQINDLSGVEFTFPDGDKLEVIIESPDMLDNVSKRINDILAKYQILSVRLPITQQEDEIVGLGDQLVAKLRNKYKISIKNITTVGLTDMESLVKTMTEMKKFLDSYATKVTINLEDGIMVKEGDRFAVPVEAKEQVILRVVEVNNSLVRAIVEKGDSRDILGNKAYNFTKDKLGDVVGQIKVNNPRQDLAYAVTETTKLLPRLDEAFKTSKLTIEKVVNALTTFQDLEGSIFELKGLSQQLSVYKDDIDKVDLNRLQEAVNRLNKLLTRLVKVVEQLNFIREMLEEFNLKLQGIAKEVSKRSVEISSANFYRRDLVELEITIIDFAQRVNSNTKEIINYINQYNPILEELIKWQKDVSSFNLFINQVSQIDKKEVKDKLEQISNKDLVYKIGEINEDGIQKNMLKLQDQLLGIRKIDLESIISEIEYIERSLPKLKDEEITDTIDLIDKHIQGQVIPGSEISLLFPAKGVNISPIKGQIQEFMSNKVSIYTSQAGVLSPNLRGQLYQILGEVRTLLTAVTAIILSFFSLFFDQTLIINSLRLKQEDFDIVWYKNESFYYGLLTGSLILGSSFYLSGAKIPYLPSYFGFVLGAILGIFAVSKAEVMNKIAEEEFKAGQALGFSYTEIMREIIIPSGKPGILKLLNSRKTYF
ncbi:hypothetical protein [Orenia marismortui]|nr:hypothetical protein [Orenia marismortui]